MSNIKQKTLIAEMIVGLEGRCEDLDFCACVDCPLFTNCDGCYSGESKLCLCKNWLKNPCIEKYSPSVVTNIIGGV